LATSAMPSPLSGARPFSSISVANTAAPSRAKASAQARPIPALAAVTKARLPLRRSDIFFFSFSTLVIPGRAKREPGIHNHDRGYGFRVCVLRTHPGMTASVVVPRHADLACDVVIAGRELHAGAGRLLADGLAIELLPGRLMGRVGEAALGLQIGTALFQFLLRDQDVGRALVEIAADLVAGLEDPALAVGGGLRRGGGDRGRA